MKAKIAALLPIVLLVGCAPAFLFTRGCSASKTKALAEGGVTRFHAQLDAEQYHEIYAQASPEFQNSGSEADLTKFFSAVHRKLGKVQRTNEQTFFINFTTSGNIATLTYQTDFSNGSGSEQFTWRVNEKQATLIGYRIDAPALITQ